MQKKGGSPVGATETEDTNRNVARMGVRGPLT
jgi:hypothetical protein